MTVGTPVVAANRGALPEASAAPGCWSIPRMRPPLRSPSSACSRTARWRATPPPGAWSDRGSSAGTPVPRGLWKPPVGDREAPRTSVTKPVQSVSTRELLGDATGVGRYLGELVRRWSERADASGRELVLYSPEPLQLHLPARRVEARIVGTGRGTWWEQTHLRRAIRADRLDVFFAPGYTAPLGLDVPLAVTIHDISFFAHPEWFRPEEGVRRRWLTAKAARRSSRVHRFGLFTRRNRAIPARRT
jgi:hypothetical protein